MRIFVINILFFILLLSSTCSTPIFQGNEEGARALLEYLVEATDKERALVTQYLKPSSKEIQKVFDLAIQDKMQAYIDNQWQQNPVITPKVGQTQVLLWVATSEDLKNNRGNANAFPGGYKKIAAYLKPELTFYRFKFAEPGESLGMAYDGLIYVNDKWVLFPKPWRCLK